MVRLPVPLSSNRGSPPSSGRCCLWCGKIAHKLGLHRACQRVAQRRLRAHWPLYGWRERLVQARCFKPPSSLPNEAADPDRGSSSSFETGAFPAIRLGNCALSGSCTYTRIESKVGRRALAVTVQGATVHLRQTGAWPWVFLVICDRGAKTTCTSTVQEVIVHLRQTSAWPWVFLVICDRGARTTCTSTVQGAIVHLRQTGAWPWVFLVICDRGAEQLLAHRQQVW